MSKINWEDDYNLWFCESDSLLEGISVNALASTSGLVITIDENTYKITKPDRIFFYFS